MKEYKRKYIFRRIFYEKDISRNYMFTYDIIPYSL